MPSAPLSATLARIGGALGWTRVLDHRPVGPGWYRCDDLLDDPSLLAGWLDLVTAGLSVGAGLSPTGGRRPAAVVPASYMMGWYLDVPAYVGALTFGLARRVPDLEPESLAVHPSPGGLPDAIAALSPAFACLPGDPAADHPDARVVRDEQALAGLLRERVASHAAAFHDAYSPGVKIGSRQRWGMLTDSLDTALWVAGQIRGDEAAGVADAALVLDGAHLPYTSASTLYRITDPRGRGRWTRRRSSCCFMFRLPGTAACFTCPRVDDAERAARLASQG